MNTVLKRGLTAILVVALATTVGGCSLTAGITRRIRTNAALKTVRNSAEYKVPKLETILSKFPTKVGKVTASIPKGTGGSTISASLETRVTPSGPDWMVDFIVTWSAADFHRPGDPITGFLDHTWEFIVTNSGKITAQRELGYFPPQYDK